MTPPPRLAEQLLFRRLVADERDELIGDIHEQFARRCETHGPSAARRWYWRQALSLVWGFSLHRRDLVTSTHERTRGRWALVNAGGDARYAWRSLKRSPSHTLVALLTLMIGIGLSTAMFSLVNAILLDPLPYTHADRLIRLVDYPPTTKGAPPRSDGASMGDVSIGAWLSVDTAVARLSPYGENPMTVEHASGADNLLVTDVGRDFFNVLSMAPSAGRALGDADFDPAAPGAAVISERLAMRLFGGAQSALGQHLSVESTPVTVVGVMPRAFAFPGKDVDIWRIGTQYRRFPAPGTRRNMAMRTSVIALLKEGKSVADANASGVVVARTMVGALIAAGDDNAVAPTFEARRLLDDMVAPVRPALLLLSVGTFLVLAVCVNLANLLLARNTARQREIAVRLALGADRWRVGRPILIELLMLASAGGAAGAFVAWLLLRAMPAMAPATFPRVENIHFDVWTLAFAVAAALATALVVGWLPTLQMPKTNVQELTTGGGRVRIGRFTGSGDFIRGALVTGQVALAVVLLVVALLIGRSFQQLLNVDLGYAPDGVLTFQAAQPFANARQPGRLRGYYTAFLERLRAHPQVAAAGFGAALPMHPIMIRSSVNVVGRESAPRDFNNLAVNQPVSADYLRAIGTRIVRGRGFLETDSAFSEKVVVVDQAVERLHFPAGDAVGHQLSYARETWTIVGIAESMRITGLAEPPLPVLYFPTEQMQEFLAFAKPGGGIAVRTNGDPRALIPFVRDVARAIDPSVPLYSVRPLSDDIRTNVAQPRFFTVILALFATLSLSTALLGIYGVLVYAVERRRMEFGIRRALGATERHVVALVMRRGVIVSTVGILCGLGGAAAAAHYLRSLLFGISAADPVSFAGAAALVFVVVLVASWQPVRRALRIDPARALRVD